MKLTHCIYCCCHNDNRKTTECESSKHKFIVTENSAKKYNWSIGYIKDELKTGRHLIACLGSAGFIFLEDIKILGNFAYGIGDKQFYDLLNTTNK